ncbi:MAG TPA: hypothetical protein VK689_06690 [Armatimonadota bacterium]|nr:hypothetical protein [Armatimonadota bacterium]
MTPVGKRHLLVLTSVLGACLLPVPADAGRAAKPESVERIGRYRLVKWSRRWPAIKTDNERETIILRDRKGAEVARISNYSVKVESHGDLTGDGYPEVVVTAWTGGAHASLFYYIYSLGRRPRCLLAYSKRNAEWAPDSPDFEPKDLDGDGCKEIVSWYDGFAYGGDLGREWDTSFGASARVPIVLGLRNGRYVDVTTRYRNRLRVHLTLAKEGLLDAIEDARRPELAPYVRPMIVQYYAVALLLHDPATARRLVLRAVPSGDRARFLKVHRKIERVVWERHQRYSYPRAYGGPTRFLTGRWPE